ncbi:oligoendopeptidase F [Oceanobacillus bengalensis]|uniref:Oligoendopeptidase F n=1 Tax=Oceanobacillus bengalensis TaxID=1435466 RepID=A0A494Z3T7_9BACI|nr:M3 family oligoendopeptidase [Oceanobacillus bengalensis]RKQ17111.1 oligoendopeptidase F [Oceanobacillus bengalensis]
MNSFKNNNLLCVKYIKILKGEDSIIHTNWNLNSLYNNGGKSTELKKYIDLLSHDLNLLRERIGKIDQGNSNEIINLFESLQMVMSGVSEIEDFSVCVYAENVKGEEGPLLMNLSSELKAALDSVIADFELLLMNLPEEFYTEIINCEVVKPYQFYIEERKKHATDKLSMKLEKAINQLSVSGFVGWEDHYELMMSRLQIPDGDKYLSIGQALNQVEFSSDRIKRKKLAKSLNEVCKTNEDIFASIINNITGFRLTTYKLRGWDNPLKQMLDQNRIQEETLNTMLAAIQENKGILHTYLERKVKIEKKENLAWYDILVPSFSPKATITYEEACRLVITQFYRFDEKLGAFAENTLQHGWVEAENRSNKMAGAFCANLPVSKESRIFMTFSGNYEDVVTLAHELGHAYHNSILQAEPIFAQQKGTSVAETASTFTENLVIDAAIESANSKEDKLARIETKIISGMKYIAMLPALFEFEQKLYQRRADGILTANEISNLMSTSEKGIYGNTVNEPNTYQWITLSHLYDTEKAFYNIPYTIGYLFSTAVYGYAKQHGNGFMQKYEGLLRNSGRMTVEELASTYLNQDMKDISFWRASIKPTLDAIHAYIELTNDAM